MTQLNAVGDPLSPGEVYHDAVCEALNDCAAMLAEYGIAIESVSCYYIDAQGCPQYAIADGPMQPSPPFDLGA